MKKALLVEIIVFLFVVLFLYAAGSKLTEYNKFIGQMGMSPILTKFAPTLAWVVPAVEITIATMLIFPKTRLIGLYASFALMVVFTLYIAGILFFSKELPCACGGVLSSLGWKNHLFFNGFYVVLGIIGITLQVKLDENNNLQPVTKFD